MAAVASTVVCTAAGLSTASPSTLHRRRSRIAGSPSVRSSRALAVAMTAVELRTGLGLVLAVVGHSAWPPAHSERDYCRRVHSSVSATACGAAVSAVVALIAVAGAGRAV